MARYVSCIMWLTWKEITMWGVDCWWSCTWLMFCIGAVAWMCRRSCEVRTRRERQDWSASVRREIERRRRNDAREISRPQQLQQHRDVNTAETRNVILPQTPAALATDHLAVATSTAEVAVVKGLSHRQCFIVMLCQYYIRRWVLAGFFQFRENWKKSEFVWSGKGQGKILFLKSQVKWSWIMQTADICDFLCLQILKSAANLQLSLNVHKLEVFRLLGGFASLGTPPGLLSFAYCSINTVSLLYDIVYHFWHCYCFDKVRKIVIPWLEKSWKSHGILLQKTCRNPDWAIRAGPVWPTPKVR